MQVRHNTTLLEQAVDHVVRRASIPLIEAEAAAQEKRNRATAFRRLATGAAIALVAVGIGLGIYLSKRVDEHAIIDQNNASTVERPQLPEVSGGQVATKKDDSRAPLESPSSKENGSTTEQGTPAIVVTNFVIFRNREVSVLGKQWKIETGHNFATEQDQQAGNWSEAWCYTVVPMSGLDVRINLGSRPTSASPQSLPETAGEALTKVGLTPFEALTLATNCPWLDGRSFDIETISGGPVAKQSTFRVDGRTLVFSGEIGTGFAAEIAKYAFDKLEISSPGGLVDEGILAGRWLRTNRKIVEAKDECLSACIFVLAGGMSRQADDTTHVGVHRFFKNAAADVGDIEFAQQKSAEILQYLQSMGIKNDLWIAMAKTPSDTIQYIEHETLRAWALLSSKNIDIPDDPSSISSENTIPKVDPGTGQEEIVDTPPTVPNSNLPTVGSNLIRLIGFDAPGNDFPNMPVMEIREAACEQQCLLAPRCMAATYNVAARACFLKTGIVRVNPFPSAITFYRRELQGKF